MTENTLTLLYNSTNIWKAYLELPCFSHITIYLPIIHLLAFQCNIHIHDMTSIMANKQYTTSKLLSALSHVLSWLTNKQYTSSKLIIKCSVMCSVMANKWYTTEVTKRSVVTNKQYTTWKEMMVYFYTTSKLLFSVLSCFLSWLTNSTLPPKLVLLSVLSYHVFCHG